MVVVAVAGGTGNMGRTIVEALVATQKHKVLVLSRKSNPALEEEIGVPIIAVDYDDIEAVAKTLDENDVNTVISAIWMLTGPSGEEPKEIQLIRAADASKTTKRMMSSDWGSPHTPEHGKRLGSVLQKQKAQAELKISRNLETTYVKTGFFMDYWGMPGVKSHLAPVPICVDIPNDAAAIPGDGNTPVIMTHSTDIAKFVAASLDLQKWDPAFYTIGDRITMNDLLHFAEEAKGKKFSVTYDSLDMLRAGSVTELPGIVEMYSSMPKKVLQGMAAAFGMWMAEGVMNYTPEKTLNDYFPEIKTLKVKDMVNRAWKKN